MKQTSVPLFFILTLINCTTASSFVAVSPPKKKGSVALTSVTLSQANQKCPKSQEFKQWSAFYGILPFSELTPEALFPNPKASYRLREEFTTTDKIYSVLLGVSTSVIRKSWIVEECPLELPKTQMSLEPNPTEPSNSPEFQASVKSAVDAYLMQKDKEYEQVLEATIVKNKTTLKLDDTLPTIWFRNGEIKQGEVLDQNQETITIKNKLGASEVVPRSTVLRIRFPKNEVKP